jgi:hypothetical protein
MSRPRSMFVCAFFLGSLVFGCRRDKGPDFAPVQGVVRLNGKPEAGLLVRLSPFAEKGNTVPAFATGKTDEQGKYTLSYEYKREAGSGAPVGWHRVTLVDSKVGFTPQGQLPKPSSVPFPYSNVTTTPLVIEVKPGENSIDLDVKK